MSEMRKDRRPKIYDLNIINEKNVFWLSDKFNFNLEFDLLGQLREFLLILVDEIEISRQSPRRSCQYWLPGLDSNQ